MVWCRQLSTGRCLALLLAVSFVAGCSEGDGKGHAPSRTPANRPLPGPVSPLPGPRIDGAVRSAGRLKLATWNIAWLHRLEGQGQIPRERRDYARLRGYADRLQADVIALQEVDGEQAARRVFDPDLYAFHFSARIGEQRTGFAYKRTLQAMPNPDYRALDIGGLRRGADLTLQHAGRELRLLSVHLKSGCFDGPLTAQSTSCKKLARQLPILERWIDERAREGTPFGVLGDFNRRMFAFPDPFWREIDDAQPPNAELSSPTDGAASRCWDGRYPDFIDHIVLGRQVAGWAVRDSFAQLVYDAAHAPNEMQLSDHCPISVLLDVPP
ncbi:MAG: endonuclease/exonuclease/phosphatase family protein [Proteobacteria bacterium]|nr:endonuclease/exonuclease/phosphatase family protein [Pseudomonadota bacterium]